MNATALRAAARRGLPSLARAVRAAGPEGLAAAWPRLKPEVRVAAFRALTAKDAARAFLLLPPDARWLAYLGALTDGAAPLKRTAGDARVLRRFPAAELARLRGAVVPR